MLLLGAHLGVLRGAAAVGASAGVGGVTAPRVLGGVDREGGEGHPHVHPAVAAVTAVEGGGGQREARLEGERAVPVAARVGRVQRGPAVLPTTSYPGDNPLHRLAS